MTSSLTCICFILLFLITAFLLYVKNKSKKNNIWNYIGITLLTIIPGIQFSSNGTDIYNYQVWFFNNANISWTDFFSKVNDKVLFYTIAKILYPYGGRILVFSFFSLIMVVLSYKYIKENSDKINIFLAEICFLTGIYSTGAFNILKQGISICIVLYGMKYIFEGNLKKYLLVILIAYGFHSSAIICVIFYFLWNHKENLPLSRNKEKIYILISAIAVFFYQEIIQVISSNFQMFDNYGRYSDIIESRNRDFYLDILVLIFFYIFKNKLCAFDKKAQYMLCLLTISVVIGFTGFYNPYFKRIAMYFSVPSKIYLFGIFPCLFSGKKRVYSQLLITLYLIALWVFVRYAIGSGWEYAFDITNKPY